MLFNDQRALRILEKYGLDALVASTPQNVVYSSDFYSRNQWTKYYGSQVYVVLPMEREIEPALITNVTGGGQTWIKDLRSYGQLSFTLTAQKEMYNPLPEAKFYGAEASAEEVLVRTLEDKGLSNKTIGFDELSVLLFERLKKELPKARTIMVDQAFKELRMTKTEDAIFRLTKVIEITEKSFIAAKETLRPGICVKDVQQTIREVVSNEGAAPLLQIVRGGSNLGSGEYKLKKNDIVSFDLINRHNSHLSDIGRTAFIGRPSDKIEKYYKAIFLGQEEELKAIKPGMKASEIFNVAVETVKTEGIPHYQRGSCGHGIGIGFDLPLIGPRDDTPLEENMVLCVETPYREIGFGQLMLEDTVVVKKDGAHFLSTIDRDLYVV